MTCPNCQAKTADGPFCGFCGAELQANLKDPLPVTLVGVRVLGGAGVPLRRDQPVRLTFDAWGVKIFAEGAVEAPRFAVAYEEIHTIDIRGPGTVQRGGGFVGGGFGVEGALVGMAVAGVLNALTSTSQTITILYVAGPMWEFWGVTAECDPLTLRIMLSPVFLRVPHDTLGRHSRDK